MADERVVLCSRIRAVMYGALHCVRKVDESAEYAVCDRVSKRASASVDAPYRINRQQTEEATR